MAIGRGVAGALVAGLMLVGAFGTGPGTAAARSCPASPLSVSELLALWDQGEVLGFVGYVNTAGRRCYGDGSIRVVGYVNEPPAIGYELPFTVDPGWLTDAGLWLYGSAKTHPDGVAAGPYYPMARAGGGTRLQDRFLHRWVSVRAHFDDPRARSCTAWDPTDIVGTTAQLRAMCRSVLVIDTVTTLGGPDTSTGPDDATPAADPAGLLIAAAIVGVVAARARSRRERRPAR